MSSISVVIPVLNESAKIDRCLSGILSQTVDVEEIIVLDSGSTDGTQDIVRRYPKTRLIDIPSGTFNHGGTRNIGVEAARSELILMTVGDAWAFDDNWIKTLTDCLADDVSAVCGMQCVAAEADTNPLEWFSPVSKPEPETHFVGSEEELGKCTQEKLQKLAHWDDVTALYRRKALLEQPFAITPYGEDIIWKHRALCTGKTMVYHPGARVYHHHLETPENLSRKTRAILALRYRTFGLLPVVDDTDFRLRYAYRLLTNRSLSFREKLHWYHYNVENTHAIRGAVASTLKECLNGETFDSLFNEIADIPISKGLAT